MEKNYKFLTIAFIALAITGTAGFAKSYFQFFPEFKNIGLYVHFHFAIFLLWFVVLIAQPLLIKHKKNKVHRRLGQATYFLAPIMLISVVVMVIMTLRTQQTITNDAIITATGALLNGISFFLCYLISMANKKKVKWHVAFIIGASLILFNPGWGRLIMLLVNQQAGLLTMALTPLLLSLAILFYEKLKLKRTMMKSPYLLFTVIWVLELIVFVLLPTQAFWQNSVRQLIVAVG